ncbi:MAG: acyl-CoA dehydrogenase C-terminal domain-containing protein [Proteobacteria bacterium]|nr:acyl-CoA dehydrogenase C-terminal domain-containing protein [Pseudomonadota bacterium]
MPTYRAPVKDMMYLLHDVLNITKYSNLRGFEEATPELTEAILREAGKLAEEVLQPLNRIGDIEGCTRNDDGSVTTPTGFKEAYKIFVEGGWQGLSHNPEYGGQGLPSVMYIAFEEMCVSANLAFHMYPSLTSGAIVMLNLAGSDEQKAAYIPKMITGEWAGTMNLTEAHCGTDLGQLRTKAEPQDDGSYKITGTKIFISSGEHDLSENIIHFVLARLPDAPQGIKGLSLFLVPKYLINADGSIGARNAVSCGALEEKMGIHGNATAVLNYDGATGWLVGKANEGIKPMFLMMNSARIGVGVQGLGLSEVAYQNAANYARERRQGRAITGAKDPDHAADLIIVHPDVRRMLLEVRAFNEGARAFAFWAALQGDLWLRSEDEETSRQAAEMVGLLTPVIKGVLTDKGFENANTALQVLGGHGYIAESGMEQFVRDARIAQIYEGTNGIQALDLVGRKLPRNNGAAIRAFFEQLGGFCKDHRSAEAAPYINPLKAAIKDLETATLWLMENGMKNPDNAAAGATNYMHLLGLVAIGYMWAQMALKSLELLAAGAEDKTFHEHKLGTANYYMSHMLPETASHLKRIEAGAETMMAMPAEAF